jgi:hypothetical protein
MLSIVYHFESDGSHNSLQALINRHVELGENDFELTLYKDHSLDDYAKYLDGVPALLLDASRMIHERLKSGREASVEALQAELTDLRKDSNDD